MKRFETTRYPEYIKTLRDTTGNAFGGIPNLALESLWRLFSEERYQIAFMVPNAMLIAEFLIWFAEEIHQDSNEAYPYNR